MNTNLEVIYLYCASLLYSPVTASLLGPSVFLSTVFTNTPSL